MSQTSSPEAVTAVANGSMPQPNLSEDKVPPSSDSAASDKMAAANPDPDKLSDDPSAAQAEADGAKKRNTSFKINIFPSRPPSNDPEESGDDDIEDSRTEDISDYVDPAVAAPIPASTEVKPPAAPTTGSTPAAATVATPAPAAVEKVEPPVVQSAPTTGNAGVRRNSSTKSTSKSASTNPSLLCMGYRFNIFVYNSKQSSGNEPLRAPAAQVRASSAAAYVTNIEGSDSVDNGSESSGLLSMIKDKKAFPKHGPQDRFKVVKIQTASSKSRNRWTMVDYANRSGPLAPPPPAFVSNSSPAMSMTKLSLKPVLKPSKDADGKQTGAQVSTPSAVVPPPVPHQSFAVPAAGPSVPSSTLMINNGDAESPDFVPNLKDTSEGASNPVQVEPAQPSSSQAPGQSVAQLQPQHSVISSTVPELTLPPPPSSAVTGAASPSVPIQSFNNQFPVQATQPDGSHLEDVEPKSEDQTSQPQLQVASSQKLPEQPVQVPAGAAGAVAAVSAAPVAAAAAAPTAEPTYGSVNVNNGHPMSSASNSVPPSRGDPNAALVQQHQVHQLSSTSEVVEAAAAAAAASSAAGIVAATPATGGTVGKSAASLLPSQPPIVGELLVERLEEISTQQGAYGGDPDPER